MGRQALGRVLATLAINAAVAEPAAYAQDRAGGRVEPGDVARGDGRHDAPASAELELDVAGESFGVPPNGEYDVSGLVQTSSFSPGRGRRIAAATALAPSLTATQDTCMGSRTFGVQAMDFGFSFATVWRDAQCRRVKNARQLFLLGYREAAVQLLCMDDEVREAMRRAGTPCEGVVRLIRLDPPEPEPEPPPLISFDDVLFDFDRSTIRADALPILEPLLEMLRADPGMNIEIEGHTDWVGSDAYNEGLSQRRAQAVVEWLVSRGIARERIAAVGRGESEPVATNATASGRQLNRRVEVRRREPNPPSASGG
jgi:outer membrane protein OmpA-like peptidoglycan-associated protein